MLTLYLIQISWVVGKIANLAHFPGRKYLPEERRKEGIPERKMDRKRSVSGEGKSVLQQKVKMEKVFRKRGTLFRICLATDSELSN